jgi:hypothetical protein
MYILKDIFICTIEEQYRDNENIHEEDRTTVKTLYLIIYAQVTGSIMWLRLWQMSVNRASTIFCPVSQVIKM